MYISSGYLPQCEGITPPNNIYSHISGIDLVLGKDGEWYILEDNLRIPSGASYPLIARELTRVVTPKVFSDIPIVDNRDYANILKNTMDFAKNKGKPCESNTHKASRIQKKFLPPGWFENNLYF